MDIETAFTPQSLDEVARLNRRWHYWPLFILRSAHGIIGYVALFVIAIGGMVTAFRGSSFNATAFGAGILGACVLIAFPIWLYIRERRKVEARLKRQGPLFFSFTNEGVSLRERNGATISVPWSTYSGFQEGKLIFVLWQVGRSGFRAIPKNAATEADVRSILLTKLPEMQ
jgi:hypothetical protein